MNLSPEQHRHPVLHEKDGLLPPTSPAADEELLTRLKDLSSGHSPGGTPEVTLFSTLAAQGSPVGAATRRLISKYISAEEGDAALARLPHTYFGDLCTLKTRLRTSRGEARAPVVLALRDRYITSGSPKLGYLACKYALTEIKATHNSLFLAAETATASGQQADFRQLLKDQEHSGSPEVLFHIARLERTRGGAGHSAAFYQRLVALHPDSLEAQLMGVLSSDLTSAYRRVELLPIYARFSKRPDQDDSLFGSFILEEILSHLQRDKPESAPAIARRLLTYNPECEAAWGVLLAMETTDQVSRRKLLTEFPSWSGVRLIAASAGNDTSNFETLLRQRIASAPAHCEAYIALAQHLEARNRAGEAQVLLRQAYALSPHHPSIPQNILEEELREPPALRLEVARSGAPIEVSAWGDDVRSLLAIAVGKRGPALRKALAQCSPDFAEVNRLLAPGSLLLTQQVFFQDQTRRNCEVPRKLLGAQVTSEKWRETVGVMFQSLLSTSHELPYARYRWALGSLASCTLNLDPCGDYLNLQHFVDKLDGLSEGAQRAYRRCAGLVHGVVPSDAEEVDTAIKYLIERLETLRDFVDHQLAPALITDLPDALERWDHAFSSLEPAVFKTEDERPGGSVVV